MTKKLEELLNLPENKNVVKEAEKKEKDQKKYEIEQREETLRTMAEFDKITSALPAVNGLGEMADKELNDIADKAMSAYDDLMDLGMSVEQRYASRIFEVAGGMLKTSLDAKIAKLDKKLKIVDLQLKKEKQDKDAVKHNDGIIEGDGYVVTDRNSLLERLKGLDKDK